MHQYLADVQTHERLAISLAKDSNWCFQKQDEFSNRALPNIESSISLSEVSDADNGVSDIATTDDANYMFMSAKMTLQLYVS